MKRFVSLKGQDTQYNFAWWDTVTDKFERHSGAEAWDTFSEFAQDYAGDDIARYRRICPRAFGGVGQDAEKTG